MSIPIIAGLIAMSAWGINVFFEKRAVDSIGTFRSIIFVHIFLFLLGLPLLLTDSTIPELDLKYFFFIFLFGAADFIGLILFYQAFKVSKVSIVTPIASSYAVVTAVVSFLFFGEDFSLQKILLILIIVAGIVLLSLDLESLKVKNRKELLGIPLAIMILFLYGIWAPLWDQFIADGGYLFTLEVERLIILFCAIVFIIVRNKRLHLGFRSKGLKYTIFSAIFILVGGTAYSWGLHKSDQTSLQSAISSSYPLSAAIVAYIFLKEKLKPIQYIGIGIIILGLVLITTL